MKQTIFHSLLIAATLLGAVTTSGCKSASGSRWAWWNPMSKSGESSFFARKAPEPPSDAAKATEVDAAAQLAANPNATVPPVGSTAPKTAVATTDTTAPPFNSAITAKPAAAAPAAGAVAKAPTTMTPTTPGTPGADASRLANAPAVKTPAAPSTSIAAITASIKPATSPAGPYDPNGYRPAMATAPTMSATSGRYGELAAATSAPVSAAPAATPTPAATTPAMSVPANPYGNSDRYAMTSPVKPVAAPAIVPMTTAPVTKPATVAAAAPVVGDRYASAGAAPAATPSFAMPFATAPVTTAPATTLPSLPAPKSAIAAGPAMPKSSAITETPLPKMQSMNTAKTAAITPDAYPSTPISFGAAPSGAASTSSPAPASTVKIKAPAGAYRPGGTKTYDVEVASLPAKAAPKSAYPSTSLGEVPPGSVSPASTAPAGYR